jgi:hypothetical protein
VQAPGQYPYVPNMTAESAVAIAGGFSPRAKRDRVTLTHTDASGTSARRGSAGHADQPWRHRARRRALVLTMPMIEGQPLKILHAVRAPVGGIFRHILDLANGQADRGHHVGIIADSLTGGERADQALAEIAPRLKLGVHRLAIRREPAPQDVLVWAKLARLVRRLQPDVLHGHGAKDRRLPSACAARQRTPFRVYTPHGGSLHYPLSSLKGQLYSRLERALMNNTGPVPVRERLCARYLSAHHRRSQGPGAHRLQRRHRRRIRSDREGDDATDVVYVGEFREIKGPTS